MLAKCLFDLERLKLVVVRRRRTVSVDVPDLIRSYPGVFECSLHYATRARARFIRHRQMKRIGARTVANDFSVDPRATFLCGFELFENHDSRALADNEAVTISFKWSRSVQGIVVVG